MDGNFIILACIILFSYTTQTISGFGSIIIALTLGANFYPIDKLLPILVPLTVILNTYLLIRYRSDINWSLLIKMVIPYMGIGLAIGIYIFNHFHTGILKNLYGIFVLIISIRELIIHIRKNNVNRPISTFQTIVWMISGGIIHGIYASGGPLIVYPVSRIIHNKSAFRSTLVALWVCFNIVLIVSYATTGRFTIQSVKWTAMLLPLIPISLLLGEWLHNYVNDYKFRIIIFSILIVAGLSIAVQ